MNEENSLTFANSFVKQTLQDLNDIKKSFFVIGFRLNEANEFGYYSALGYKDIYELAADKFGFEKTSTKNLMAINFAYCDHYCGGKDYKRYTMYLSENYDKYSQTQLVEMLPLTVQERKNIPADFTISELREYKKILKAEPDYDTYWAKQEDPRKTVKEYREQQQKAAQISSAPDVQRSFNNAANMEEFYQSGAEELSSATVSQLTDAADESEDDVSLGEVLEESGAIGNESDAADTMAKLKEKYLYTKEEWLAAQESFVIESNNIPKRKPHNFKNKKERENFILDPKNFPVVVLDNPETGLRVTRCDFANGAKLYRTTWTEYLDYKKEFYEHCRLCLVDDRKTAEGFFKNASGSYSQKTYVPDGTANGYVVDYMTKFSKEI